MGHNCNYFKRENGKVTLYYSHWGALAIARDFFWGRDAALRFLDAHDPANARLLDDVFGEGGAAVDLDERTLTISGGEIDGPARTLLIELASVIWARDGFTVRDVDSLADVAEAVGVDRAEVEVEHRVSSPLDPSSDVMTGRSDAGFHTAVVIDGVVRFTRDARNVLELGEAKLALTEKLPDLAEAKRTSKGPLAERVDYFLVIDTAARRIETLPHVLRNNKSRQHYATKWASYELVGRDSNAIRSALKLPDFPPRPPEPEPSLAELVAEVESYLFDGRSGDLGKWFADYYAKKAEPGSWINPHATATTHDGRPSPADANEILRSALAEVAARRRRSA